MMGHQRFQILVLFSVLSQYAALFESRDETDERIRIHLSDDERLLVPQHGTATTVVKLLYRRHPRPLPPPSSSNHIAAVDAVHFHAADLPIYKQNKKQPGRKYVKQKSPAVKLTARFKASDVVVGEKNCCGGGAWKGRQEVLLEELFRPVTLLVNNFDDDDDEETTIGKFHEPNLDFDDGVKPVTEHIEDDLKYDFRTKTHSL